MKYLILFLFLFRLSVFPQVDSTPFFIKNLKLKPRSFSNDTALLRLITVINEGFSDEEYLNLSKEAVLIADQLLLNGGNISIPRVKLHKSVAINNIGFVYAGRAQWKEALDQFYSSLKIQEEILKECDSKNISFSDEIKKVLSSSLNNIGVMHNSQGQLEEALSFFKKSLKMEEGFGNSRSVANIYSNIGLIYINRRKLGEALYNLNKSLEIEEKVGNKKGIAFAYNNIGFIHKDRAEMIRLAKGSLDSVEAELKIALGYYRKSLKMQRELSNKQGIAYALGNIGTVYFKQNQNDLALAYHDSALKLSKEVGSADNIKNSEDLLAKIYTAMGKPGQALEHYRQYIIYRDSISNQAVRKEGIKKQMQYDFEKKEALLREEQFKKETLQDEKLKRQKLIYWSASGALVLALLFTLLLFNRSRLKQKNKHQQELNLKQKEQANAVMETQEQERKRIAEDLHDSLGHLLSTAKLNLQTLPEGQKQIESSLHLLNQAADEIRNITFNLMPRTLEEGGLIPALNELAAKVNLAGTVKVLLHVHNMEKFTLEKQSQFNIYRIVQEAVNNILKHAAATEINIQLLGQDAQITIMIEDDGKGFDPKNNKSGRGLKNIVTRSLWLKGNINIDSSPGHGTTITTEIPV